MAQSKILAMYDIRGKQNYIYKSTKLKEIIGASKIIKDLYEDYLFPAAKKISEKGIYNYNDKDMNPEGKMEFSYKDFEDRMVEKEGYIGELIYDGGGNFFVLYRDEFVYREVNKIFSRSVLENTYSLRVLTSYVEIKDGSDYKGDERRLREKHAINERRECIMSPVNAVPIVQVDRQSSLPLAAVKPEYAKDKDEDDKNSKITLESAAKYKKYEKFKKSIGGTDEGELILDNLITEKGVDSHLAVIYIDGNNMGAKVSQRVSTCKDSTYDSVVTELRKFSKEIQQNYIDKPKEAINELLKEKNQVIVDENKKRRRIVVGAGDEITLICNAKDAYDVVNTYFDTLAKAEGSNSSCAGVAIFHSHAPFSEAYRIAEECCETGKTWMKQNGIKEACLMDFHYCQGAIGTSLEDIRESEDTSDLCKPWLLKKMNNRIPQESVPTRSEIQQTVAALRLIAHSNAKNLLFAAREGEPAFEKELQRILAHLSETDRKQEIPTTITLEALLKKEKQERKLDRKLVYRIMLVYDLWFREADEGKGDRRQ